MIFSSLKFDKNNIMKYLSTFICLIITSLVIAQNNPLIKEAPLNPIVLKYKLEHFNLVGNIETATLNNSFQLQFNEDGLLVKVYNNVYDADKKLTKEYKYPNKTTILETKYEEENGIINSKYTLNNDQNIIHYEVLDTKNIPDYYILDPITYEYKDQLLIKATTDKSKHNYNFKSEITTYKYDNKKRLIQTSLLYDNEEDIKFRNTYDYSKFNEGKILFLKNNGYYQISQDYNSKGTLTYEVVKENGYKANPLSIIYRNPKYDEYGNLSTFNDGEYRYTYFKK